MRFAPNIEFLFTELDSFEARVEAAAACGAEGVEMWGFANKSLPTLRRALDASGVEAAAMVIDPLVGALAPREEFLSAVDRTLDAAHELACATVIVISGPAVPGARCALVDALRVAADQATAAGLVLALEALNTNDHPLAWLKHLSIAMDVAEEVDSAALGVVVDLYHTAVMGDRIASAVAGREHLVRHVQLSSGPDRHEPLGAAGVVADLLRAGYEGFLGLEYRPLLSSTKSIRRSIEHWKGMQL